MSALIRRGLPVYLMGLCATLVLADYYVVSDTLHQITGELLTWAVIISAFAIILGLISLMRFHYNNVKKREPGTWYLSIYAVCLTFFALIWGLVYTPADPIFGTLWWYLSAWIYMICLTLCGFYQISAAYRAFRIRRAEGVVLFIVAFITLIGWAPIVTGPMAHLAGWVSSTPNLGVMRAIEIGSGVGIVILGMRLLIGRERTIVREAEAVEGGG